MKRICVLTMAIALLAPVAVLTAGPAGAAGGTTCAKPTGSITISPGLTGKLTVQTIKIVALPIKACKGGGVTSGTTSGSIKTPPINIGTFASGAPVTLNATITWNNHKTTTFSAKASPHISSKGAISATVKGKVTKGLFLNSSVSVSVNVKLGPLVKNAIHTLNITGSTAFTIK